jgi:hypothetical protein
LGINTSTPLGKFEALGSVGSTYISNTGNSLAFTRNGANYISALGGTSSRLLFTTGGTVEANTPDVRWSILATGIFESNGAQTIQTSSDDLTLQGTGLRTVFGARTRHTPITAPTTGLNAGDMYYDSATNRMRFRRASDWVEMGMLWDTVGW